MKIISSFLEKYLNIKLKFEIANFHPLVNTATVSISPKDLIDFIRKFHKEVNMINMNEFQK